MLDDDELKSTTGSPRMENATGVPQESDIIEVS